MRLTITLTMLLLCLLFAGCVSAIYYRPNTINIPMLRQKGQGSISAYSASESFDFQGTYSPRANLGLLADGSRIRGESSGNGRGYLLEAGAGYYRPIKPRFHWDAYGLIAFGGVENRFASIPNSSPSNKARYVRYGVQPSLGFQSRYFDLAGAARLVRLSYFDIRGAELSQIQYLRDQSKQVLFEPVVNFRFGRDPIRFQIQLGNSFNWTNKDFPQKDGIGSLGIIYTFGDRSNE